MNRKDESRKRREAEISRGALAVKKNMLEGLVEQLAKELDPQHKFQFHLLPTGNDPRQWGVRVVFSEDISHAENVFDFPTDELKAKIMLLYGK